MSLLLCLGPLCGCLNVLHYSLLSLFLLDLQIFFLLQVHQSLLEVFAFDLLLPFSEHFR